MSCEEDYILDTSEFEPTVVLDGLFAENQPWKVTVRTTRNIYDVQSKSTPIEDATILVTELNGTGNCRLYHIGNGIYESTDCSPRAETAYRIFVEAPGYDIVTATSSVPKKAKVTVKPLEKQDDLASLQFTIEEQSELEDFYIWDLIQDTIKEGGQEPGSNESGGPFNPQDLIDDLSEDFRKLKFQNSSANLSASGSGFIGSAIDKNITGNPSIFGIGKDTSPNVGTSQIVTKLRVMTVSKELFKYYTSIESYLQFQDYQTSITESRTIFNNIKGGVGIFAGYSYETFDIVE